MRDASTHRAKKLVPVEPPTRRPRRRDSTRMAASDTSSGTRIMRSITLGTNDGSTRGRPMPSMPEPRREAAAMLPVEKASKNAECSGSATQRRVARRL